MNEFAQHGLQFRYPEDWTLDEVRSGDGHTITVSSPGTSFWCISLFPHRPAPEEVLDTACQAFEDEYEEVDVYEASTEVAGENAAGRDIEFVCLELVNSAVLRAVATPERTILVLYQGTDHELEDTRRMMERITESLVIT